MNDQNFAPFPADISKMTEDEKIKYIQYRSRLLEDCRESLRHWNAYDPNEWPHDVGRRMGPLFECAQNLGLDGIGRICLIIFKAELEAKIRSIDLELKSMLK